MRPPPRNEWSIRPVLRPAPQRVVRLEGRQIAAEFKISDVLATQEQLHNTYCEIRIGADGTILESKTSQTFGECDL